MTALSGSILTCLGAISLLGIGAGACLIAAEVFRRKGHAPNGKTRGGLNRFIPVERVLYRHHGMVGLAITAGSLYNLHFIAFRFDPHQIARLMTPDGLAPAVGHWLVQSAEWLFWPANALALILGAVLYLRPSLLKGWEAQANRWRTLDSPRPDDAVSRSDTVLGILLLTAGVYVALTLILYLQ